MKIGFIQFSPTLGDVQATIRKIDGLMDQLTDQSKITDILVLPELTSSLIKVKSQTFWYYQNYVILVITLTLLRKPGKHQKR